MLMNQEKYVSSRNLCKRLLHKFHGDKIWTDRSQCGVDSLFRRMHTGGMQNGPLRI